jgi:leader peptidase (prepilin peptidase)/N-methyltransferase
MRYAAALILGLITGSFLNVCIYRIPKGQSVVFQPSKCPDCGSRIRFRHMVPVISYLLMRGRCTHCKSRVSAVYPFAELLTGVLYLLLLYRFGFGLDFIKYSFLLSLLIVTGFIDYEYHIIPDRLVMAGVSTGTVFMLINGEHSPMFYITGVILGSGILLAVNLLSGGGMGIGDIKLMAVIGLFLGWQNTLTVLFLSFVTGGIAGALLLFTGKKGMKDAVPFGPFLGGAAAAAVFLGQQMISLYLRLI